MEIIIHQSCPRATFLGPDPKKRWPEPTRPAIAEKSLTLPDRPDPPPPTCTMFHEFNIKVANRHTIQLLHDFEGNSVQISLQVL